MIRPELVEAITVDPRNKTGSITEISKAIASVKNKTVVVVIHAWEKMPEDEVMAA
jgi:hypothetical protein